MAIFTRYAQVLEADGSPMPVRSALVEINRMLDETLARQEGDLDPDTRFCASGTSNTASASAPTAKRWADEAHAYNILVTSWPQIRMEAARLAAGVPEQAGFGFSGEEAS